MSPAIQDRILRDGGLDTWHLLSINMCCLRCPGRCPGVAPSRYPRSSGRTFSHLRPVAIVLVMEHPLEVRRLAEDNLLKITWNDGHVSLYPLTYVRGWCPCAVCQGHGGERHYVPAENAE